jgi:hypothetical protein
MMLVNPYSFSSIDAYVKSWMLFNTLDDLITDNTWSGGTLSSGQLVGSSTTNTLGNQSRFNTNAGEFTIEFDFTPDATDNDGSNHGLVSFGTGASNISYFIRYASGYCAMVVQSSISAGFQFAISCFITGTTGQKYRIALQRKAGVYQMYLDGVLLTPLYIDNAANSFASSSNQLKLGHVDAGVSEAMSGAMGNFKFSNGIARY